MFAGGLPVEHIEKHNPWIQPTLHLMNHIPSFHLVFLCCFVAFTSSFMSDANSEALGV